MNSSTISATHSTLLDYCNNDTTTIYESKVITLKSTKAVGATMSDKQDLTELVKALSTAGIIGVVSASIKALMTYKKDVNLPELIRTFFAGVLLSILVGYFLMFTNLSELWKSIIVSASAAFISTFWPLLEKLAKSYFIKKTKDVLPNINVD